MGNTIISMNVTMFSVFHSSRTHRDVIRTLTQQRNKNQTKQQLIPQHEEKQHYLSCKKPTVSIARGVREIEKKRTPALTAQKSNQFIAGKDADRWLISSVPFIIANPRTAR